MTAVHPSPVLMKKYRTGRGVTLSQLAQRVFGSKLKTFILRGFEEGTTLNLDDGVWEKVCVELMIPEEEQDFGSFWQEVKPALQSSPYKARPWGNDKETALRLPTGDETQLTLRPVNEIVIKDDMALVDIVTILLASTETDSSLAAKLGMSERNFHRRYQQTRRDLLTAGRFHALRAAGFKENLIAQAHGYSRKTLWRKKLEWGIETTPGTVAPSRTSHSRKGLPTMETKWGPAYEYRRGYYLIRIRQDSTYWHHPIAPHNQVLLHRIIMLEHLLERPARSEFLTKVDGKWTLHKDCQIHHVDGDTSNNNIENLQVAWRATHIAKHWHGAHQLHEALLGLIEGRETISSSEIRELLDKHFED